MDDEPITDSVPGGALVPQPMHPSTALATAAPLPPRREHADDVRTVLTRVVDRALDTLDSAGDSIARAVGLR